MCIVGTFVSLEQVLYLLLQNCIYRVAQKECKTYDQ